MLLSQVVLQELTDSALDGELDVAELFIDLMAQDFPEKKNLVVLFLEVCNCLDDGSGLVDDDAPEAVLLVQVRVEVLFHRLPGLVVHVHALVVVFDLL